MADALKDAGNKAFQAKNYDQAIELFSKAIEIDPSNHVLWSNRSAAHAGKKQWAAALDDAEQCVKINPTWSKGYARKGAALHGERKYDEAIQAYEAGLKIEDSPALRKGLKEVTDAKQAEERDGAGEGLGLGKLFSDPGLFAKLAGNPRTAKHLADPSFVQKLNAFQQNPKLAENAFQADPRMIDVLGALMGIDMRGFSREEGSDELPPGVVPGESAPSPAPARAPSPPPAAPKKEAPKDEDVQMAEPDDEPEEKKQADEEKKKGAEAYKARDLDNAIVHFQKAWDIYPKEITYLTNLAAAYFEKGEYDKCIETCEKAVDEGREIHADFKLIAKAYGRIGSAHQRKGDLPTAIKFFNKSLTEHRTPDILNKLRQAERDQAEAARLAYLDPEKAAAAREEGNTLFKAGDFAGAVKAYTEAIKRDPNDPRGYNNRANAYTKLAALPEALKDAEEAIRVDPAFVKAYIRKSHVLFAMRDYTKAIEAVQQAADIDEEKKHTREIQEQVYKCNQAMLTQREDESEEETLQRAMRDPEIARIMGDPIMQSILQQAQSNPAALEDHMKNPTVRQNIMKLINAGIIKTRR
ncbi:putative stress-induced protein STI1 [Trametes meyenii]|nr:putative stress-induced protein STI1 [Trametes meyenii]